MANIKITDLDAYADPKSTDVLPAVDVTNDETKKVSIADLMENAGSGTEALPGIAFDGDPNTGIYRPGADQLAISTAGTQRLLISDTGAVTIPGDLTVQGTTTTIDTTNLIVEDKNIEMGSVTTPTDTTADGGGITLKGATDKTLNWVDSTDSWTSSENVDLASGKTYKINGTDVLSATALGSAVQISSDNIPSGTIVNDDVNASAAIAGTKISADFGAQNLTVDTDILFVDATNDRVSVGTTSPLAIFDVKPSTNRHIVFIPNSDYADNGIVAVNDAGSEIALGIGGAPIQFFTQALERVRIDSDGRLLVGTNSDISGGSTNTSIQVVGNANNTTGEIYLGRNDTGVLVDDEIGKIEWRNNDSDGTTWEAVARISAEAEAAYNTGDKPARLVFATSADGVASPTERMRISANGNITVNTDTFFVDAVNNRVGIGVTSPLQKLHIEETSGVGAILIEGSNLAQITLSDNNGGTDDKNFVIRNSQQNLLFGTQNDSFSGFSEAVRIDSSGDVEIMQGNNLTWVFAGGSTHRARIRAESTDALIFETGSGNDERMRIDPDGRLLIGSNSAPSNQQIQAANTGGENFGAFRFSDNTGAPDIAFHKSRGSLGDHSIVSNDDAIGSLVFRASDGSAYRNAASVNAFVDGTPGDSDMPGRLVFSTNPGGTALTERMRISADGNVRIGAGSPSSLLSVQKDFGDVSGSSAVALQIGNTSTVTGQTPGTRLLFNSGNRESGAIDVNHNTAGGDDASMNFVVRDASNTMQTRMVIDAAGNVGIGTESPATPLHVEGTNGSPALRIGNSAGTTNLQITANENNDITLQFRDGGSDRSLVFSGNSERMRIDSSGRLLVGTSSSGGGGNSSLQVRNEGGSNIEIIRSTDDSNPVRVRFTKSRGSEASPTSVSSGDVIGEMRFHGHDGTDYANYCAAIQGVVDETPGTDDMPGRLVFRTTADGASSPTERMRINRVGTILTASTGGCLDAGTTLAASTSYYVYRGRHSATAGSPGTGTVSFSVLSNGNVENTNDSYGAFSDIKLKENIVDAESQWDDFKAVRFRKYNFKEETGHETFTQLGVIAQELELVSPGLVTETPDLDDDGNDLGTTTKSVKYSVLTKKALVALQEAMERIEQLEAKVAALEAQ